MERNIKLDLFKGVAISLVLIGHSIQGACTIENSDCFENIFFKTTKCDFDCIFYFVVINRRCSFIFDAF